MAKKKKKLASRLFSPELNNASMTVLANIRFAGLDDPVKTICVTSANMDEGKTTFACNLAAASAASGQRTLLVDCDLRRRSIAGTMGIQTQYGIYSVMARRATLAMAIVPTSRERLYLLDGEPNIPSPPDILSTKTFEGLMARLRESFDFVIFDTPPLGSFIDAALVSHVADGALLVVREKKTKRTEVVEAINQLQAANARVLGTVLTFADKPDNDYYYYYSKTGKRKNKSGDSGSHVK